MWPDLTKFRTLVKKIIRLLEFFCMVSGWYLANFCTYFGNFMLLAKFPIIQMSKDWKIIKPSGHTALYLNNIDVLWHYFKVWKYLFTDVANSPVNVHWISKREFQPVWPDLGKFRHFGKMFRFLAIFSVNLILGIVLNLLWPLKIMIITQLTL